MIKKSGEKENKKEEKVKEEEGKGVIIAKKTVVLPFLDEVGRSIGNKTITVSSVSGRARLNVFTAEILGDGGRYQKRSIAISENEPEIDADVILPSDFFDYL